MWGLGAEPWAGLMSTGSGPWSTALHQEKAAEVTGSRLGACCSESPAFRR